MSIRNFVPTIWSANVETALRKTLVYGGPMVANRNYEGEIRSAGDTVKITSVGRPTIQDYVPGSTAINPEPLNTGQRVFQVDQAKYFAFEVDDVDKAQAQGDFMPAATGEAGYGMSDVVDRFVAGLHTQIPASGLTASIDMDTTTWSTEAGKAYDDVLVALSVLLDEQNVPEEGRYAVVPPWFYGVLRRDGRFIEADKSANAGALRTGMVGDAAGFTILRSNNVPNPSGDEHVITAGTSTAITFASQITEIEAYRPESSFSDAVKGLSVYGAKVVRPDCIVKATVTRG